MSVGQIFGGVVLGGLAIWWIVLRLVGVRTPPGDGGGDGGGETGGGYGSSGSVGTGGEGGGEGGGDGAGW